MNVHNVLVARMALAPSTLADTARVRAAWKDVLDRARSEPGVEAAAIVDTVPMRQGYNEIGYWTSADVPPENRRPVALATSASPDYFKVMGLRLRAGRFFDERDRAGTEPVIVIDDVLAQHAFGARQAVGERLWMPEMGTNAGAFRVIGVVGHVRHWGLAGDDQALIRDQFYYPFAQLDDGLVRRWSELMSVAVRTSIPPLGLVQPLRRDLRGATGDQVLYQVRTLEQLARATLDRERFLVLLFGIFAGLALLLACVGIYGVLAYLTSRRVPEIGVRMALGATARDVVRMVLRQSLGMIVAGVALGATAALAAVRVLERTVEGMRGAEPLTVALMSAVLMAAALFASFLPARRAGRIEPMRALRED
jgi:predicted permease